jgi:hypothetical protein
LKEKTEVGSIVEKCSKEKRYGKSETFYCREGEKASFVRRFPGFAVRIVVSSGFRQRPGVSDS